jgi:hypothetical protein
MILRRYEVWVRYFDSHLNPHATADNNTPLIYWTKTGAFHSAYDHNRMHRLMRSIGNKGPAFEFYVVDRKTGEEVVQGS